MTTENFLADYSEWTVVYNDHSNSYIHLDAIKNSNPTAQILLGDLSSNLSKHYCWRNSDNLIRNWLRNNISQIKNNKVAILEWDVLVTQKLPDIKLVGAMGKHIHKPTKNNGWKWFKEINKLEEYKKYAIGIAPLGILFIDRGSILSLIDSKFDDIFNKNIFCELRLPTILNSLDINISQYPMPNVQWHPVKYTNQKSIYHAIKKRIV